MIELFDTISIWRPMDFDEDEILFALESNSERTEITIKLSREKPLTLDEIILELEYYINEVSRAIEQRASGGARTH